jgi:uncharacterized protein YjbI with pentapeptide repeats
VILNGVKFTNADLRGAVFTRAFFLGVDFTNADLRGANLNNACHFQNATWTGAIFNPKWEKIMALFEGRQIISQNLQRYDLSSVCFENIEWEGPDFSYANLAYSEFWIDAGDLANANFRWANLVSANLAGANLTNADFRDANLSNTDLEYAILTGAQISAEQLSYAILNDCTRLPDGSLFNEEECKYPTHVSP